MTRPFLFTRTAPDPTEAAQDPRRSFAPDAPHLVLVHLGKDLPEHMLDCAEQALDIDSRLVLWVLASTRHHKHLTTALRQRARLVATESLEVGPEHRRFSKETKLDGRRRGGFWRFATERFFVIEEWMRAFDIPSCFHCENDVLLYTPLSELMPLTQRLYPGLAITLDNDARCIPGFLYIGSRAAASSLVAFLAARRTREENDMVALAALYQESTPAQVDSLPIVPPGFAGDWTTPSGLRSRRPSTFLNHAEVRLRRGRTGAIPGGHRSPQLQEGKHGRIHQRELRLRSVRLRVPVAGGARCRPGALSGLQGRMVSNQQPARAFQGTAPFAVEALSHPPPLHCLSHVGGRNEPGVVGL
jgi:hypothetical protein